LIEGHMKMKSKGILEKATLNYTENVSSSLNFACGRNYNSSITSTNQDTPRLAN